MLVSSQAGSPNNSNCVLCFCVLMPGTEKALNKYSPSKNMGFLHFGKQECSLARTPGMIAEMHSPFLCP